MYGETKKNGGKGGGGGGKQKKSLKRDEQIKETERGGGRSLKTKLKTKWVKKEGKN